MGASPNGVGEGDVTEDGAWDEPAVTPFLLHQQELLGRQESMTALKRTGSSFRRLGSVLSRQQSSGYTSEAKAHVPANQGLLPVAAKSRCRQLDHEGCCHTPELEEKMLHQMEHLATAQSPKKHLAALLSTLLVVVAVVAVLCASKLLACGTWQYWLVVLTPLPNMALIWVVACWHVLWRAGWQACLDLLTPQGIHCNTLTILLCPAMCISVGVLAGLLGMGGGMIMAPLLLEFVVNPPTSPASSQAAMLLSTCTSCIIYLVNGAVPQDYGLAMAILGCTGTLVGKTLICYIIKRTGRSSMLVFTLALLFVLAVGVGCWWWDLPSPG